MNYMDIKHEMTEESIINMINTMYSKLPEITLDYDHKLLMSMLEVCEYSFGITPDGFNNEVKDKVRRIRVFLTGKG